MDEETPGQDLQNRMVFPDIGTDMNLKDDDGGSNTIANKNPKKNPKKKINRPDQSSSTTDKNGDSKTLQPPEPLTGIDARILQLQQRLTTSRKLKALLMWMYMHA